MFVSRLDNARKEVIDGKSNLSGRFQETKESKDVESPKQTRSENPLNSIAKMWRNKSRASKILRELNEYLFDLFDANCMEDFHKMDKFEQEAIKLFDSEEFVSNPNYEFSHQQYQKHQEFLQLFESLVESFLRSNHYTAEQLYEELEAYSQAIQQGGSKQNEETKKFNFSSNDEEDENDSDDCSYKEASDESNALEIVNVISYYTSFEKWCEMMRENVKLKRYFRSFEDRMKLAATDMRDTREEPRK